MCEVEIEQSNLLNEPLNIAELLTTGSHFEISNDFGSDSINNSDIFDDFGIGSDGEDDNDVEFHKTILSPWKYKFDELKMSMVEITDGIYKKIIKNGDEKFGLVPSVNARVVIEYNSYQELDVKPVDSTYLRGSKQTINTGVSEVIPGLEIAICTMTKGETAHFVISYKHLFGELGCPPRIPAKCDLLFTITIYNFTDVGDLNATDNINEEDRYKFSVVFPNVKEVHKKGKDFFQLQNYALAAKTFYKAVQNLECCQLADKIEEEQQKKFLLLLYTNLAICFHKKDLPKKVCSMLNCLRKIDEKAYYRNVKALYFEGQALFKLSEFSRAKICFKKAQRIEPDNNEINIALQKLVEAEAKYKKFERELCERTFGIINDSMKVPENNKNTIDEEIRNSLEKFKLDVNSEEMCFPPGLTSAECIAVEEIIKDVDLKLRITPLGGKKIVKK